MRRLLSLFVIALFAHLVALPQATSLTIDCQMPGWLTSYIGPSNISTLRNLKVTGTINEADLQTIGNLVKNYSLQGRLDLEDVTIVGNKLSYQMFGVTNCSLQYFSLPISIERNNLDKCIQWVSLDTLVIGGSQAYNVSANDTPFTSNMTDFFVKCVIVREGTIDASFAGGTTTINGRPDYNYTVNEIVLPHSLERLYNVSEFRSLEKMNIPENIKLLGTLGGTTYYNNSDTLFVPSSVTQFFDSWALPDGYYGVQGYDGTWHPGRIKCVYLPEALDTLWINTLGFINASVFLHMKTRIPPRLMNSSSIGDRCTVFVPVGCKDAYPSSIWGNVIEETYATSIDIIIPSCVHKGDSLLATASILPENTTFKDVYWSSDNPSLLTISNTGMLHALECGSVSIRARTADRSCSAKKEIQIYEHTTGIELDKQNLTVNIGDFGYLVANTLPIGLTDNQVRWSSSNELIASVDENGVVRALKQGECIIVAESVDGGFIAQCAVRVKQPVVGVIMDKHSTSINVGQGEMLYATASPVNADNKKLIWSSSDSEIVEVDADGYVTAKKRGVAFVKSTSEDNPLAADSCKVNVNQPVTGVSLNHENCELHQIGETLQLVATVLPEDASNKDVRWVSSNESVCIVSNGTVVAVGYGISVIIVTTVDGNYMATCTVTVVEKADLPGDVNHDGEVNIADINVIIDIILGSDVDDQTRERADVNGDGEVNIADINAIIDIIHSHSI